MSAHALAPLAIDPPSLSELAYERLRAAIVDGTLAPGAKLSERTLAATLAISAQPVREALRRLEGEGMVETKPRSGTFVAQLDAQLLHEMGHIRAVLEGACAGFAARKAGPVDIAALQARLAEVAAATRRGDPAALAAANDAFHTTLHEISGNAFLTRSLQALRAYFHIGSSKVLIHRDQARQALDEHAGIVAAVAEKDAERAESLMRAHTLRSLAFAFPQQTAGAPKQHSP